MEFECIKGNGSVSCRRSDRLFRGDSKGLDESTGSVQWFDRVYPSLAVSGTRSTWEMKIAFCVKFTIGY